MIGHIHAWVTLLPNNSRYPFDRWLVGPTDGLDEMEKTVHATAEKQTTVFNRVGSHFTD
jgi:hypothetical protein